MFSVIIPTKAELIVLFCASIVLYYLLTCFFFYFMRSLKQRLYLIHLCITTAYCLASVLVVTQMTINVHHTLSRSFPSSAFCFNDLQALSNSSKLCSSLLLQPIMHHKSFQLCNCHHYRISLFPALCNISNAFSFIFPKSHSQQVTPSLVCILPHLSSFVPISEEEVLIFFPTETTEPSPWPPASGGSWYHGESLAFSPTLTRARISGLL